MVADDKNQVERFKETARQLGCDEDEATFKEKLGVIARQIAPKAHTITPFERAAISREITKTRPPRTAKEVELEIVAAKFQLQTVEAAFDNYSGNNPNKYQSALRRARKNLRALEAELTRIRGNS